MRSWRPCWNGPFLTPPTSFTQSYGVVPAAAQVGSEVFTANGPVHPCPRFVRYSDAEGLGLAPQPTTLAWLVPTLIGYAGSAKCWLFWRLAVTLMVTARLCVQPAVFCASHTSNEFASWDAPPTSAIQAPAIGPDDAAPAAYGR